MNRILSIQKPRQPRYAEELALSTAPPELPPPHERGLFRAVHTLPGMDSYTMFDRRGRVIAKCLMLSGAFPREALEGALWEVLNLAEPPGPEGA